MDTPNPADVAADVMDYALETIAEARPMIDSDDYTEITELEIAWERAVLVEVGRLIVGSGIRPEELGGPITAMPVFQISDPQDDR